MITQKQINDLSKLYQIDGFTTMREYLQLVFLSYLYQKKEAKKIYFKGGTAIRLLFGSPRFSEDLDFSTTYGKKEIKKIVGEIEKSIQQEIPELKILHLYSGKKTERFRIKYQSGDNKYPLVVRLDFYQVRNVGRIVVSPLLTKFPIVIFPLISHLTETEILKEKIQALVSRGKGLDFFDVWYLLGKGVKLMKAIDKKVLLQKIRRYSQSSLRSDLSQFLPKSHRGMIDILKDRLQKQLVD